MSISKNARKGDGTQKFFCECGGVIKMITLFDNGKLKNKARCDKCGITKRKPRDFNLKQTVSLL